MTTPASILSLPLSYGRDLVAGTTAFRSFVGATTLEEAVARLHYIESPRSLLGAFGIIDFGEMIRDRASLNSTRFQHRDGSTLVLYLNKAVADANDEDAILSFSNEVGAIWEAIELAAGKYDARTLSVKTVELLSAPARISYEQRPTAGDYFEAILGLTYSRQP